VLQELAENVFADTGRPAEYDLAVELEKIMNDKVGPEGDLSERRFLLGHRLSGRLGIPREPVYRRFFAIARGGRLGWPTGLRAARQQSHLSAGADLRRQDRCGVCAAREAAVGELCFRAPRGAKMSQPQANALGY